MASNLIVFECVVTRTQYDRDQDNYAIFTEHTSVESAPDLPTLYAQLAKLKTQETPAAEQINEYTTIEFGIVREIIVVGTSAVEETILHATDCWKQHEAELQAQREERNKADEAAVAQKEAAERAQLAQLMKKYPDAI